MDFTDLASRGGKAPKKPYKFGIQDISDAANKNLWAVRKDRQRKKFDPHNLTSLSNYIHECNKL